MSAEMSRSIHVSVEAMKQCLRGAASHHRKGGVLFSRSRCPDQENLLPRANFVDYGGLQLRSHDQTLSPIAAARVGSNADVPSAPQMRGKTTGTSTPASR